jgi:hypothetical protein
LSLNDEQKHSLWLLALQPVVGGSRGSPNPLVKTNFLLDQGGPIWESHEVFKKKRQRIRGKTIKDKRKGKIWFTQCLCLHQKRLSCQ